MESKQNNTILKVFFLVVICLSSRLLFMGSTSSSITVLRDYYREVCVSVFNLWQCGSGNMLGCKTKLFPLYSPLALCVANIIKNK